MFKNVFYQILSDILVGLFQRDGSQHETVFKPKFDFLLVCCICQKYNCVLFKKFPKGLHISSKQSGFLLLKFLHAFARTHWWYLPFKFNQFIYLSSDPPIHDILFSCKKIFLIYLSKGKVFFENISLATDTVKNMRHQ